MKICVERANVHNLKSLSVKIPKNALTVITGPSGSGKSSLAFDTIYVEGQRRYIESLSSYARQFMGQQAPPEVESITGLSPAIAIDQKTINRNPRSTVGTTTEIYDYLRVLFARIGTLHCPDSGVVVKKYTPPQIVRSLPFSSPSAKLFIGAPLKEGASKKQLQAHQAQGYTNVIVDGKMVPIEDLGAVPPRISLVVDRLFLKKENEKRITDGVELALAMGGGVVECLVNNKSLIFSTEYLSPITGRVFPDLGPKLFSFNSPLGACPQCNGLGSYRTFSEELLVHEPDLPLLKGALALISKNQFLSKMIKTVAQKEGVDLKAPYRKLPKKFLHLLFHGATKKYLFKFSSENSSLEFSKSFPGIIPWLEKKYQKTSSEKTRKSFNEFIKTGPCPQCCGQRLNDVALSTKINDHNIFEVSQLTIHQLHKFLSSFKLSEHQALIAKKLLKEILSRTKFLLDVGLDYLTMNRPSTTLSGGEAQRIRLATQIGSALSGVLYVLDEPSIGLHQRDNGKLIKTLKSLRDLGNTVLVVEHDEETIKSADYLIDMGPGAGVHGGKIMAQGPWKSFLKKNSLTAQYLNKKKEIVLPKKRRSFSRAIELTQAKEHNIKGMDFFLPLEVLVCVTGVSGSGKSTLVHEILVPALKSKLSRPHGALYKRSNYSSLEGDQWIDQIIELDQSPIGRTPHSNPATYTGLFGDIRSIFARTKEAQVRGYRPGRFSFNVKGGRCEYCEGHGAIKVEMHFLPDVYITCRECRGRRYNEETLGVLYKGKSIADVLEMDIEQGASFFSHHPKIHRALKVLVEVGLGYMKLGQSATTLSGGEAQRLKLSRELSKRAKERCLYILDEPTTGLHFHDIQALLRAIGRLLEEGHSVLVIEHNLDVIKTADWIVDLGPGGGDQGGTIVAQGTPEEIVAQKKVGPTGKSLAAYLR